MEVELKRSYPCLFCGAPTEAYGAFDATGPLCLRCWHGLDEAAQQEPTHVTATIVREEMDLFGPQVLA